VEAGANEDEVRAGLGAGTGDAWVDGATGAAETAGVRGTPTVLLDGARFTDGRTVDELADNLMAELR
jgi:DSBA-like thioredoxin domain